MQEKKLKAWIDNLEIKMKVTKLNGMTFAGSLYIYDCKRDAILVNTKGNFIELVQYVNNELIDLNYIFKGSL